MDVRGMAVAGLMLLSVHTAWAEEGSVDQAREALSKKDDDADSRRVVAYCMTAEQTLETTATARARSPRRGSPPGTGSASAPAGSPRSCGARSASSA